MYYSFNFDIYIYTDEQPAGRFTQSNKLYVVVMRLAASIYGSGRYNTIGIWFADYIKVENLR